MTKLINTNPLGEVDLPLIGRSLEAGEEFEVSAEDACGLLDQAGNYALADGETDPRSGDAPAAPVAPVVAAPDSTAAPTPAPKAVTPEPAAAEPDSAATTDTAPTA